MSACACRRVNFYLRPCGRTDTDDPEFRANFDKIAEGLAAYQREAMTRYADTRLS